MTKMTFPLKAANTAPGQNELKFKAQQKVAQSTHEFYSPSFGKHSPVTQISPTEWQMAALFAYAWELPHVCLAMQPAAVNRYIDLTNTWKLPENKAILDQPGQWADKEAGFLDWGGRIVDRIDTLMSGEYQSEAWNRIQADTESFIIDFFNFDKEKPIVTWQTCPTLAMVLTMQTCLPAMGLDFETFDHWLKEYQNKEIGRAMHNQFTRKPTTIRARKFRTEALRYKFGKLKDTETRAYCMEWYAARVIKGNVTWAWEAINDYLRKHTDDTYLNNYNGDYPTRETIERHVLKIDKLIIKA